MTRHSEPVINKFNGTRPSEIGSEQINMTAHNVVAEIYYPESDGEPMAETDLHRNWMIRIIDILQQPWQTIWIPRCKVIGWATRATTGLSRIPRGDCRARSSACFWN